MCNFKGRPPVPLHPSCPAVGLAFLVEVMDQTRASLIVSSTSSTNNKHRLYPITTEAQRSAALLSLYGTHRGAYVRVVHNHLTVLSVVTAWRVTVFTVLTVTRLMKMTMTPWWVTLFTSVMTRAM